MKRSMQAYLAAAEFVDSLFADAELDWRDAERIRFVARRRHGRARTEQQPVDQPVGLEGDHRHRWSERRSRGATLPARYGCAAADSVDGGARRIHGRRGSRCHAGSGRLPQRGVRTHSVHTTNREGVDGAAADGAAGDQQVLHLGHRQGRSMVEYLLRQGHQVFAISWRNPTAAQRSWGCDTYGGAIVDALDTIRQ